MKILYLASWFRANEHDTVGSFFAEQAATFAERGNDVAIACCTSIPTRDWRKLRSQNFKCIEEISPHQSCPIYRDTLAFLPRAAQYNRPLVQWQYENFLKKVLRDFGKPDVVHIQSSLEAGIHSYRLLRRLSIPYGVTEHATFFRRNIVPEWKLDLVRECFKYAQFRLAVSEALIDDLEAASVNADIEVAPNIYDPHLFRLTIDRPPLTQPNYLVVCYLNKKKAVDVLLHAFSRLIIQRPTAQLSVAGDGPERERLEQLAGQLNLTDSVTFLGSVDRQRVSMLMQKTHCLVSSSQIETFGVTLIEGLACGLPVVATRSGGPEEFIREPFGRVVPTNDPISLSQAMLSSLDEYHLGEHPKLAQERSDFVQKQFSPRALFNRLLPIYETMAPPPTTRNIPDPGAPHTH